VPLQQLKLDGPASMLMEGHLSSELAHPVFQHALNVTFFAFQL